MIRISGLSFGYPNGTRVLCDAQGDINFGDMIGLFGGNGAGKSTLLKLITGELIPSSGDVTILGTPAASFKNWRDIAYIPQNAGNIGKNFPATALEVVELNFYERKDLFRSFKKEYRQRAQEALNHVGLGSKMKEKLGDLSGGQRQKVMIARALVNQPQMLILDEPTAGLDEKSTEAFYHLLTHLHEKHDITIFMVSHDFHRGRDFFKRFWWLQEGKIQSISQLPIWDFDSKKGRSL